MLRISSKNSSFRRDARIGLIDQKSFKALATPSNAPSRLNNSSLNTFLSAATHSAAPRRTRELNMKQLSTFVSNAPRKKYHNLQQTTDSICLTIMEGIQTHAVALIRYRVDRKPTFSTLPIQRHTRYKQVV